MNGDEQLLNRRVYGADHDDPHLGPLPHRTHAEWVDGPLDGLLLDIHGWRTEEADDGVALTTELGRWPGGRALYDPRPANPAHRGPASGAALLLRRHILTPAGGVRPAFGQLGGGVLDPQQRPLDSGRHPGSALA